MKTATVIVKDRNYEVHKIENATSVNLSEDKYAAIDCEDGSQTLFAHNNILTIEIKQNKEE